MASLTENIGDTVIMLVVQTTEFSATLFPRILVVAILDAEVGAWNVYSALGSLKDSN